MTSFLNHSGSTHLQMMKNGQDIGRAVAYPDHESTGSINVIVNLQKGEVVLLRHWAGIAAETIYGNKIRNLLDICYK